MAAPVLQHERFTLENDSAPVVDPLQTDVDNLQPYPVAVEAETAGEQLKNMLLVAELGHTGVARAAELQDDLTGPSYARRLPCLERKRFDPQSAHLRLEVFSGHNIFVTSLNNFDAAGSTTKHPLPAEFRMFSERRERLDTVFANKPSTAKADVESRRYGLDLEGSIFNSIDRFLQFDSRGRRIIADMGLDDTKLADMSPKESIYLIGYLMHELTNYQNSALNLGQGRAPADRMNSLQILQNGLAASNKQSVKPLGVCRNFADVGEALFNAFKSRNPQLTNIYCNNAGGYGGATMGELHEKGEDWKGHAWLDFVAVGPNGDMAITTVDPTWTSRDGRSLSMYDMSGLRISTHTRNLLTIEKANYTSRKAKNLERIAEYYEGQVEIRVDLLKKMFSNGQKLDLDTVSKDDPVLKSAMYFAIDYIVSASDFGGSAFYMTKSPIPRSVMSLVHQAAKDPNIILSPKEYDAVSVGLHIYKQHEGISDLLRAKIVTSMHSLKARYAKYSQTDDYKTLFGVNEGSLRVEY